MALGMGVSNVRRHRFPGAGMAVRCLAPLSEENLNKARKADAIMEEELNTSGSYRDIGQAFAVLLTVKRGSGSWETADSAALFSPVKSLGDPGRLQSVEVMGDSRRHGLAFLVVSIGV
eukprot:jgi/Undpi1/7686/HiC_scaffold_23.g10159.m1